MIKTVTDDKAYRMANMSTDKRLQFQIHWSDAETAATTWSLADTEHVSNQLERAIYGVTLNEQMQLKREFLIRLIKFESWWDTIGIQALWQTI